MVGNQGKHLILGVKMKKDIHPDYVDCTVTCSCGNSFKTRATKPELKIDICNICHPFYTGTQKLIDTGGRVQRFSDRFGSATELVKEREAAKKAKRQAMVAEENERKAQQRSEKAKLKEERAQKFAAQNAEKQDKDQVSSDENSKEDQMTETASEEVNNDSSDASVAQKETAEDSENKEEETNE